MRFPLPVRLLTPTGWVVAAVVIFGTAGLVKQWYSPRIVDRWHTVTETVEVPVVREVEKWRTRIETRTVRIAEAPLETRKEAKAREGEELMTAVNIPSAPHGGTAQAWLAPEGTTRIMFRPDPPPFLDLGGQREVSAWVYAGDRYAVRYRQDLGRIGPTVVVAEAGAEMRRGEPGWFAGVGGGVRF